MVVTFGTVWGNMQNIFTSPLADDTTYYSLDPVHTYPDIFESTNFFPDAASIHMYLVNLAHKCANFLIRSPEWKFLNMLLIWNRMDTKSRYFF